jgi:hypothetical protein
MSDSTPVDEALATPAAGVALPAPNCSNRQALAVGYLAAVGEAAEQVSEQVSETLGGKLAASEVRALWSEADLAELGHDETARCAAVPLSTHEIRVLSKLATVRGITPEEWIRRVVVACLEENLFEAVVDEDHLAPPRPKCTHGGDRKSAAFRASRGL